MLKILTKNLIAITSIMFLFVLCFSACGDNVDKYYKGEDYLSLNGYQKLVTITEREGENTAGISQLVLEKGDVNEKAKVAIGTIAMQKLYNDNITISYNSITNTSIIQTSLTIKEDNSLSVTYYRTEGVETIVLGTAEILNASEFNGQSNLEFSVYEYYMDYQDEANEQGTIELHEILKAMKSKLLKYNFNLADIGFSNYN
ncbi:MAG: hypothetical protein IJ837_00190 [Clostridia bacterium]|nr:hypothetical protein [Clostridia bacterium]